MERLTISADVRERRSGVPSLLADLGAEVETVTLAVGD
jgi:ERCC4-type nuclease